MSYPGPQWQDEKKRREALLEGLREARRQHDPFGVGTYPGDDNLEADLLALGDAVEVERYEDGSAWWRART